MLPTPLFCRSYTEMNSPIALLIVLLLAVSMSFTQATSSMDAILQRLDALEAENRELKNSLETQVDAAHRYNFDGEDNEKVRLMCLRNLYVCSKLGLFAICMSILV